MGSYGRNACLWENVIEWAERWNESLAGGGKGLEIDCPFMPTIAGVAQRLKPCRLGATVRIATR